jgi:hypothetical protein
MEGVMKLKNNLCESALRAVGFYEPEAKSAALLSTWANK